MSIDKNKLDISFEEFNKILNYFRSNNYSFVNESLQQFIKYNIKSLFPNLNYKDSEILYLFAENLIEKIANYFYFEKKDIDNWKQNNFRDIKGIILILLPFIDDKNNGKLLNEMTDLNQFLFSEIKNYIPKELDEIERSTVLKSSFKFSNMSLGLLNLNNNTPLFESDNQMKLIYKILLFIAVIAFVSCDGEDSGGRKPVYVKPSVDKNGRVRKGHMRMPVSTKRMLLRTRINPSIIIRLEGSIGGNRANS
jgi:hypothetical protein